MRTRLCCFLFALPALLAFAAGPKPNILWLVAEDINPHLGCFGDTNAVTPNLDRFAATGLRYGKCWSTAPVCAPARTSLITGVYAPTLGAEHMRSQVALPPGLHMYPTLLRELGYYCVNNNKEDYNLTKPTLVWHQSSASAHWSNRPPGQPFFAAINMATTHEGQIRTRKSVDLNPASLRLPAYHPDTPEVRLDWARYYQNIHEMDGVFQRHLDQLHQAGLAGDTIVFFYGDNGSGMPRSKRWPYNSGLHVPLIVRVPEKFRHLAPPDYAAGRLSDRLVSFADFAPTLLSIAGTKPPSWMQGHAFMGEFPSGPPRYLYGFRGRMDERYDLVRSVRNSRYIYIRNYLPHLIYGQHIAYMFETPTTRVWKQLYDAGKLTPPQTFFWEPKPAEELYDLQTDPDEVRNLTGDPSAAQVLAELRSSLREHLLQTRDAGFVTEAEQYRAAGHDRFALAQAENQYPMKQVLQQAELASATNLASTADVRVALKDPNSSVRYWAVLGLLLRGSEAVKTTVTELRPALDDPSPSVRVIAARALGEHSPEDLPRALDVLKSLAPPDKNGVFTCIEALSAIEALGSKADSLKTFLRTMPRQDPAALPRTSEYSVRFISYLLGESQTNAAAGTASPPRQKKKGAARKNL